MSKKNGKNRRERGEAGTQTTGPEGASAPAEPRKKLTVPERLVAKSRTIKEIVTDIHRMAVFYGAPAEISVATHNLMVEVDTWCGAIKEKVDGGWQPVVKADLKELAAGDKIAVTKESAGLYSYIPSGVALVAGQIERSSNGRIKRVLLSDERFFGDGVPEGAPVAFGWAQLSHLERR